MTEIDGNGPHGQNVYVIEHEHGYHKIGVSEHPGRRLSKLQSACPYDLELLGEIHTSDPFAVESTLHEKYEVRQKRGEWYDLTTREQSHLLTLCDLSREAVNRRYAKTPEERRELTLTEQGLVG